MANRLHQPHVPLPEIHWSPNEQWVWRKLRRGESACLNLVMVFAPYTGLS